MLHTGTCMKAGYTSALSHGTVPHLSRPSLRKKNDHVLQIRVLTRLFKMSLLRVSTTFLLI